MKIKNKTILLLSLLLVICAGCSKKDDNEPSNNSINIPTSAIPAGMFIMGSPVTEVNRNTDETQFAVTLSAFRMSKYDVTNSQYAAFLNAKSIGSNGIWASAPLYPTQALIYASLSNYDFGLHFSGTKWVPVAGYENNPVIDVTWYGAAEYATYVGGSLPTEAQWEYACRAGTIGPTYSDGSLDNIAWYVKNSFIGYTGKGLGNPPAGPRDVGAKLPNKWGMQDILGNNWEWCRDWYGPYPGGSVTDPTGPINGTYRVNRGGSFGSGAFDERSANRAKNPPNETSAYRGFRVAMCVVQR